MDRLENIASDHKTLLVDLSEGEKARLAEQGRQCLHENYIINAIINSRRITSALKVQIMNPSSQISDFYYVGIRVNGPAAPENGLQLKLYNASMLPIEQIAWILSNQGYYVRPEDVKGNDIMAHLSIASIARLSSNSLVDQIYSTSRGNGYENPWPQYINSLRQRLTGFKTVKGENIKPAEQPVIAEEVYLQMEEGLTTALTDPHPDTPYVIVTLRFNQSSRRSTNITEDEIRGYFTQTNIPYDSVAKSLTVSKRGLHQYHNLKLSVENILDLAEKYKNVRVLPYNHDYRKWLTKAEHRRAADARETDILRLRVYEATHTAIIAPNTDNNQII